MYIKPEIIVKKYKELGWNHIDIELRLPTTPSEPLKIDPEYVNSKILLMDQPLSSYWGFTPDSRNAAHYRSRIKTISNNLNFKILNSFKAWVYVIYIRSVLTSIKVERLNKGKTKVKHYKVIYRDNKAKLVNKANHEQ